jgi:hypothetical protein
MSMILIVAIGIALSCLFLITVFWLRQRSIEHERYLSLDSAEEEDTFTGVVVNPHLERERAEQRAWVIARKIAEQRAWDLAREVAEQRAKEESEHRAWVVARKIAEQHAWKLARELAEERK